MAGAHPHYRSVRSTSPVIYLRPHRLSVFLSGVGIRHPRARRQSSLVQAPVAAFGLRPARTRIFHFIQQESLLPHCCAVVAHVGAGTLLTPPQ